jgi:hypothetical protein
MGKGGGVGPCRVLLGVLVGVWLRKESPRPFRGQGLASHSTTLWSLEYTAFPPLVIPNLKCINHCLRLGIPELRLHYSKNLREAM